MAKKSKKKSKKKSGKKAHKHKVKPHGPGSTMTSHPLGKMAVTKIVKAVKDSVGEAMRAANKRGSGAAHHAHRKSSKPRKGSRADVGAHMRAAMSRGVHLGEKVTLASIAKKAGARKTWVCSGPVRSGCGGGKARLSGARVNKRLKPCR